MIYYIDPEVETFINYLKKRNPQDKDLWISVLHGYDSVCFEVLENEEAQDFGFAAFLPNGDKPIIILAGETPEDIDNQNFVLESFAHEYCHFIQFYQNRFGSEEADILNQEAETFALTTVKEFTESV